MGRIEPLKVGGTEEYKGVVMIKIPTQIYANVIMEHAITDQ